MMRPKPERALRNFMRCPFTGCCIIARKSTIGSEKDPHHLPLRAYVVIHYRIEETHQRHKNPPSPFP